MSAELKYELDDQWKRVKSVVNWSVGDLVYCEEGNISHDFGDGKSYYRFVASTLEGKNVKLSPNCLFVVLNIKDSFSPSQLINQQSAYCFVEVLYGGTQLELKFHEKLLNTDFVVLS